MPSFSGPQVDSLSTLALALSAAALVFLVYRRSPRLAFASWIAVLCFVPYWFSVTVVLPFAPTSIAGAFILLSLFPIYSFRFHVADLAVVVFSFSYGIAFIIGTGNISSAWVLLSHWLVGYGLGRLILLRLDPEWIYRAFAFAFTGVAAFAIVEFVTAWNPFVLFPVPGRLYDTWGTLLERGGLLRAEGAFGHPIALGTSIALVIPLVFASGLRLWAKVSMISVMLVSTIITFSRTAMICAVIGAVLSLVFVDHSIRTRVKVGMGLVLATLTLALLPIISGVFGRAGDEATGSAAYRGELFALLDDISLIGLSPAFQATTSGASFENFNSIDNELLLIGLLYGAIPLLTVTGLLIAGCIALVTKRATAPIVSLVAQIPAFFTVAFITQYGTFVWVIVGLAVSSLVLRDRESSVGGTGDLLNYGKLDRNLTVANLPRQRALL